MNTGTIDIFTVPALASTANPTAATILVNGSNVSLDAYNINDNNYFKLRDIGEAFDFGVDWDGAAGNDKDRHNVVTWVLTEP